MGRPVCFIKPVCPVSCDSELNLGNLTVFVQCVMLSYLLPLCHVHKLCDVNFHWTSCYCQCVSTVRAELLFVTETDQLLCAINRMQHAGTVFTDCMSHRIVFRNFTVQVLKNKKESP